MSFYPAMPSFSCSAAFCQNIPFYPQTFLNLNVETDISAYPAAPNSMRVGYPYQSSIGPMIDQLAAQNLALLSFNNQMLTLPSKFCVVESPMAIINAQHSLRGCKQAIKNLENDPFQQLAFLRDHQLPLHQDVGFLMKCHRFLTLKNQSIYQTYNHVICYSFDFAIASVLIKADSLVNFSQDLRNHPEIILAASEESSEIALRYAQKSLLNDVDFVTRFLNKQAAAASYEKKEENFSPLSDLCLLIIKRPLSLYFAPYEVRDNKMLLVAILPYQPGALAFASKRLRSDDQLRVLAGFIF